MNATQRTEIDAIKEILAQVESFPKNQVTDQTGVCVRAMLDTEVREGLLPGKRSLNEGARIRNILDFKREVLGEAVAENTRESYRKLSLKPLCEAGMAERHQNSINDPNTFYTLNADFERMLREASEEGRARMLRDWNEGHPARYEALRQRRRTRQLSIELGGGEELHLSPGLHSSLTKQVVDVFAPAYIPRFEPVYISDTRNKMLFVNGELTEELNLELDEHDRLPDLILYRRATNILYPIEVVTSVGPFSESRKVEVHNVLSKRGPIRFGLICITAFPNRAALRRFIGDIAGETKVWIAEEHYGIINFDLLLESGG